ncbi:MAG: HAMP domain-containing protein [Acidobacteriota bacterium]
MDEPEKRRTTLVDRRFQFRFVLTFVGILLIGAVLSGALIYFIATRSQLPLGRSDRRGLVLGIIVANGVSLLLLLYPTARVTLRTSHRISGPIRRFQNIAASVKEGNLEVNTRLREGDQLTPMAQSLGEMVSALKEKLISLQQKSEVLTASIEAAVGKSDRDVYLKTNIREDLMEIRRHNEEILKELLKYRL